MKSWKDIKNKGRTPEHIARLDEEIQAQLAEMSLREVREAAGLTQERAAELIQMTQSAYFAHRERLLRATQSELSKLERRQTCACPRSAKSCMHMVPNSRFALYSATSGSTCTCKPQGFSNEPRE